MQGLQIMRSIRFMQSLQLRIRTVWRWSDIGFIKSVECRKTDGPLSISREGFCAEKPGNLRDILILERGLKTGISRQIKKRPFRVFLRKDDAAQTLQRVKTSIKQREKRREAYGAGYL